MELRGVGGCGGCVLTAPLSLIEGKFVSELYLLIWLGDGNLSGAVDGQLGTLTRHHDGILQPSNVVCPILDIEGFWFVFILLKMWNKRWYISHDTVRSEFEHAWHRHHRNTSEENPRISNDTAKEQDPHSTCIIEPGMCDAGLRPAAEVQTSESPVPGLVVLPAFCGVEACYINTKHP